MEKRCYGCMKEKVSSPICEHCGFDEGAENASHQLPLGTVLRGQYLVGKVLGQGGFGITYLGWDLNLEMPIAIKEYFPRGHVGRESAYSITVSSYDREKDPQFQHNKKRFMREARVLARLEDIPQVVRIKNFFEENNTAYIIMEYVKGMELRDYVRQQGGKLSPEETFRLLKPILEALTQVHKADLVHRDISPDNIMLLPNGKTKLLDFGAVRYVEAAGADKALSHSTQAILKHGFAPIEQYQSKGSLGPWTDVYALCGTIYFCLTGEVPPEAGELILDDMSLEWGDIPGLTEKQRQALAHGSALRPTERTASVEELYAGLYEQEEEPEKEPEKKPEKKKAEKKKSAAKPEHRETEKAKITTSSTSTPRLQTAHITREVTEATREKREESRQAQTGRTGAPGKKKKKKWLLPGAAAVIALAAVLGLGMGGGKTEAPESTPTETAAQTAAANEPIVYAAVPADPENTMMVLYAESEEDLAFGTEAKRGEVGTITFLDRAGQAPETAMDVSALQNGKVKAWAEKNGTLYDLYIAAEGGIFAPEDCSTLFGCMPNLTEIDFGGTFCTANTRTMYAMFYGCASLKTLDVSGFDTANVEDMSFMFSECFALEKLNVRGFDTGKVTNMSAMFQHCEVLTELALSSFDTGNVLDMSYMFKNCRKVKTLDVSGFKTGKVRTMRTMFQSCESLKALDISGFDLKDALDLGYMFSGCTALTSVNADGVKISSGANTEHMFSGCPAKTPEWYKG